MRYGPFFELAVPAAVNPHEPAAEPFLTLATQRNPRELGGHHERAGVQAPAASASGVHLIASTHEAMALPTPPTSDATAS